MNTTMDNIINRLNLLGIPVAQTQFIDTKKDPAPSPPFIIWITNENARGADYKNNIVEAESAIELYTDIFDKDRRGIYEAKIESSVLHDIEFRKYPAPVPSENMFQTAYEFTIIEKRSFKNG